MNFLTIKILFIFFTSLLSFSCVNQSESSMYTPQSINGTYNVNSGQFRGTITVYGDSWSGSIKLCDHCETTYDSGSIQNGRLYDNTGYIDIGYVSGNIVTTTFGGQRVILTN